MVSVTLILSLFNFSYEKEPSSEDVEIPVDIYMSIKSSRPGCELTDSCYVPSIITINRGDSVTWLNNDVAFHTVTSGYYGNTTGIFDSGHIDPGKIYTKTFTDAGEYPFFCTLHPWMAGTIIVK